MTNLKEREERYSRGRKCFSIPYEAWYADTAVKPFEKESVIIGFYDEHGGTAGEFRLEWSEHGIQLKAFDDSWGALNRIPELLPFMDKLDLEEKVPAVEEFAELLRSLGYKDITKRGKEWKRQPGSENDSGTELESIRKIGDKGLETTGKRCYVLICNCYSGENSISVFWNYSDAYNGMLQEVYAEEQNLREQQYQYDKLEKDDYIKLYTAGEDIYYEWYLEESIIR